MEKTPGRSPQFTARIAGVFYLITFLLGSYSLFVRSALATVAGLIAAACYAAVTLLFYSLFKPVNKGLSLLAAVVSFVGLVIGPLSMLHLLPFRINPLVFFGFYCLIIGYLILKSTFLPRVLGALMIFAGLGWLTFISSSLVKSLYPYNMVPGLIGEGALTLWLLVKGVNAARWQEKRGGNVGTLRVPEPEHEGTI
jgi:hypothetical protein